MEGLGEDSNIGMKRGKGGLQRGDLLIDNLLKVVFDPFNGNAIHAAAHHSGPGCVRSTDAVESAGGAQGTHGSEQRAFCDFKRRFKAAELHLCIAEARAKETASIIRQC